ncbi:kinase-like protein [Gymnopus androsaceus JB14]|uniref:Kinase-like protein n=1 Tax=Gymnopus androsaceus JB14 TaxID=1447944 RepID=A0A6A4HJW7_9AGAR|nr:kinase-like protein [Gymnopus androsaceus JB14]
MSFTSNAHLSMIGYTVAGRYELLEIIGAGAYGTVFRALDIKAEDDGPFHYAIKVLNHPERVSGHENVIGLYEVFREKDCVFLLLELSGAGTLYDFLIGAKLWDSADRNEQAKSLFLHILDGVQHCHSRNVYHRDLKPDNILCSKDGKRIQIADFGLATGEQTTDRHQCGTKTYIPPESMEPEFNRSTVSPYDQDIWALGVILVNILTGRNPWQTATFDDEWFRAYLDLPLQYLYNALGISKDAAMLLKRILSPQPSSRLKIDEIRQRILHIDDFFQPGDAPQRPAPGSGHADRTAGVVSRPASSHRALCRTADGPATLPLTTSTSPGASLLESPPDSAAGPITPDWMPVLPVESISELGKRDAEVDLAFQPTSPPDVIQQLRELRLPSKHSISSITVSSDIVPPGEFDIAELSSSTRSLADFPPSPPSAQPQPIPHMVLVASVSATSEPKPTKTLASFLSSWVPLCGRRFCGD